eukprot:TRINITY_DN48088_c0_g1_i1.p1 TRINITY_DN48088_c0_g1~~TRINITY_DN48088_c0_g1_i1.p1  ORF type:complete len:156 (-),score=39.53 TRINITY_DN48088_c0_g1_i1:13-480(-)
MIRRPPRSTLSSSSAASDVYKRQLTNMSMAGLVPHPRPPGDHPLLFIWGNMTRGKPRGADSLFFDQAWVEFVESCPDGTVVEGTGDHWIFHENPMFVNQIMRKLSLIHISEPTRLLSISYAVFCLKKKKRMQGNESRRVVWVTKAHVQESTKKKL